MPTVPLWWCGVKKRGPPKAVAETSLRKILLATDGSEDATLATRITTDLSGRTGAELHVAHAWHSVPSTRFESFIRTRLKQEARQLASEQVERIKAQGGDVTEAHIREGPAVDEILDLAEEIDADLIAVGSRGLGPMKRLALGSVSEGIVHHSSRPVLVARGGERAWPPARIVVGDDGSEDAKRAGELAAEIGSMFGAEGLLVRAHPPFRLEVSREGRASQLEAFHEALREEANDLKRRASKLEGVLESRVRTEVIEGDAALAIAEEAERGGEPTLVAVGSRGLGPIERLRLGSVSTKVVRAVEEPVLVCPHARRRY
jgi:nucleotide-binding universal stress UspA family protein